MTAADHSPHVCEAQTNEGEGLARAEEAGAEQGEQTPAVPTFGQQKRIFTHGGGGQRGRQWRQNRALQGPHNHRTGSAGAGGTVGDCCRLPSHLESSLVRAQEWPPALAVTYEVMSSLPRQSRPPAPAAAPGEPLHQQPRGLAGSRGFPCSRGCSAPQLCCLAFRLSCCYS